MNEYLQTWKDIQNDKVEYETPEKGMTDTEIYYR